MHRYRTLFPVLFTLGAYLSAGAELYAARTAEEALVLVPVQADVDFDRPSGEAVAKCKLEAFPEQKGWAVYGPDGQLLRRFLDTNRDRKLDQWCYYKNGIEIYRDLDTDFNGKADQYRWLGTSGMRWGIDKNEDGEIDSWKAISPEEVTAEVVAALREKNAARFQRLLLTTDELTGLGLGTKQADSFRERIQQSRSGFADLARTQLVVDSKSQWLQFGATRPGVIPAETEGSTKDLLIYDNVAALIDTEGRSAQVFIGTLVRVGDGWRVVDLPKNEAPEGTFVFLAHGGRSAPDAAASAGVSENVQKLITELERIDKALLAATGDRSKLNADRANALEQLAKSAAEADRALWIKQFADMVAAAVQAGDLPTGIDRLNSMLREVTADPKTADLVPYVKFRSMAAEYGQKLTTAKENEYSKVQEQWIKDLEQFVNAYPKADESSEALLQLGLGLEFAGNDEGAAKAYGRIVESFSESEQADKARGAKFRLECVGKELSLQSKTIDGQKFDLAAYRNRGVVLLQYWATWCELCKQDMQQLKVLQAKYGPRGFHVVGVNLDNDNRSATQYLSSARWPWLQLYEDGGMDSRLANQLGIQTLPTMILIDKSGRVVRRNVHISELEGELQKLIK
ncbi:MAG: redoxin family protein [Pirellulaceae bacterium]